MLHNPVILFSIVLCVVGLPAGAITVWLLRGMPDSFWDSVTDFMDGIRESYRKAQSRAFVPTSAEPGWPRLEMLTRSIIHEFVTTVPSFQIGCVLVIGSTWFAMGETKMIGFLFLLGLFGGVVSEALKPLFGLLAAQVSALMNVWFVGGIALFPAMCFATGFVIHGLAFTCGILLILAARLASGFGAAANLPSRTPSGVVRALRDHPEVWGRLLRYTFAPKRRSQYVEDMYCKNGGPFVYGPEGRRRFRSVSGEYFAKMEMDKMANPNVGLGIGKLKSGQDPFLEIIEIEEGARDVNSFLMGYQVLGGVFWWIVVAAAIANYVFVSPWMMGMSWAAIVIAMWIRASVFFTPHLVGCSGEAIQRSRVLRWQLDEGSTRALKHLAFAGFGLGLPLYLYELIPWSDSEEFCLLLAIAAACVAWADDFASYWKTEKGLRRILWLPIVMLGVLGSCSLWLLCISIQPEVMAPVGWILVYGTLVAFVVLRPRFLIIRRKKAAHSVGTGATVHVPPGHRATWDAGDNVDLTLRSLEAWEVAYEMPTFRQKLSYFAENGELAPWIWYPELNVEREYGVYRRKAWVELDERSPNLYWVISGGVGLASIGLQSVLPIAQWMTAFGAVALVLFFARKLLTSLSS